MHSGGPDFSFLLPFTTILLTVHFKKGLKLVPDKVIYKNSKTWMFLFAPSEVCSGSERSCGLNDLPKGNFY